MKIRTLLIVIFASVFALPGLACGPMTGGGEGHHHKQKPKRAKWTKTRLKQLEDERHQLKHGGPGFITKSRSKLQQLENPFAVTDADIEKERIKRAKIKNAIEYLALKNERGQLDPAGQAKLRALINYYRTNYLSGY